MDLDRVKSIIRERNARRVGLQFPEGLKRRAPQIVEELEDLGVEVLVSGDPCYGACDTDLDLLRYVDILFHFGHAEISPIERVVYVEVRSDADPLPAVERAVPLLEGERVGVFTTVQHVHTLPVISEKLREAGLEAIVGRGDSRVKYPGQVLGCNFSAAKVEADSYLFIGSGRFHPLGVAVATRRRVVAADPYTGEAYVVDPERVLRQRHAVIAKSLEARVFCILVSTKDGQTRLDLAEHIKSLIESNERDAYMVVMDEITPEQLRQFRADAYVNTACPRIAIDEVGRFPSPMLTPPELEVVLGVRPWKSLEFDEIMGEIVAEKAA